MNTLGFEECKLATFTQLQNFFQQFEAAKVTLALEYLHEKIHRDLKPENILITTLLKLIYVWNLWSFLFDQPFFLPFAKNFDYDESEQFLFRKF